MRSVTLVITGSMAIGNLLHCADREHSVPGIFQLAAARVTPAPRCMKKIRNNSSRKMPRPAAARTAAAPDRVHRCRQSPGAGAPPWHETSNRDANRILTAHQEAAR
jgi:hypothetical protein